jgi:sulfoxide reductase heme-binding subunit YedZ
MFFYTTLHLLVFAQVYVGWDVAILLEELLERPYVMVGFAGWVLLAPLALTSSDGMRRRLRQRWRQLHRLVYAVSVLAVLHVLWLSRSDIGDAVFYGILLGGLLLWRLWQKWKRPLAARL